MIKRFPLSSWALAPLFLMAPVFPARAQEANEKALRYYGSLLKRPVPGAAFDRFYGAWLDTETLESLEKWLTARAEAPDAPAGARLLLAYFYSRQSEPAKALEQFGKVTAADPGNAEAWYQKAMAAARLPDPAAALRDLAKAEAAGPPKLLAGRIREARGRLLARQGQPEEARKIWRELLAANPDDADLAEDLMDLQVTEGLYEDALASVSRLLERTKDAYKKIRLRMRQAEIELKAGRRDAAVRVWTSCLEDTGSDSWLEKEILAQLEQAFRREDAMEPLMKEMASLAAKYPQRLTLRRRQAALLAETGDTDGAAGVYRSLLELAPGDRNVREGFIDLLRGIGRPAEAAEQLRELVRLNPADAELPARLADLQAENGDKAGARASLELFLEKSDGGEAAWLRTAAALDRYGLPDEALARYEGTAGKFPLSAGAREAWAAALHARGKKEEAFRVWRELAKGADAQGLAAVARAAAAREEHALAFELLREREGDFGKDAVFLTLLRDEAAAAEKPAEALPRALRLVAMARDAVDLESAVSRCVKLAEEAERTDALRAELQTGVRTPQEKCLLAELLDRHADPKGADALLREVAASEPELATALLVRLQEQRNDHAGAADSLKKLIAGPGGRKAAHVQRLVELYRRSGRTDEALTWIPEWKKLSPGSVLPWQAEAELQTDAGRGGEALRALRQAAQEFEGNEDLRARLAAAYRSEGQPADAQRIYMGLYEASEDTLGRIRWAGAMAEVAKESGRAEDLIETFEQRRRAAPQSPAPLLALAEIHRVMENYTGRRQALLEAVRVKPGDAALLMEIARIAEQEEKYDDALETLREAEPLDQSGRVRRMITRVLFEAGREEEGMRGLRESFTGPPDAVAVEDVADSLVTQELWGRAADFLLEQLPHFPDNYRLHYYCAVALEQEGRLGAEFDPAAPAEGGPEAAPVADTGGADRKTGAVELFLKVRTMTAELPPSALPPGAPSAAAAGSGAGPGSKGGAGPDFYTELAKVAPAAAADIMRLSQTGGQAYQHRQRGPRGISGTAGGLTVPPPLQAVRALALVHLLNVGSGLPEKGRAALAARLEAEGLPQAQWLMDAGPALTTGASRQIDLEEPLSRDPGNETLNTLQVLWATGNPATTAAQLLKSQAVLRERWPVMARMAALGLIRGEAPEERAEFAREVDVLASRTEPPEPVLMSGITQALYQINNRRNFLIPEASRVKFAVLQNRILPWLRADARQRQNLGYVFLQLAAGLAEGGDLTPLVRMLDEEIAWQASEAGKKAGALRLPGSGPAPQPSSPLAQEPAFPPAALPDFPFQVLQVLNGQGLRAYGLTVPAEPAQWAAALPAVRDPVLRVLVAHAADDSAAVARAVAALTAMPEPGPAGLLLAAALAGKNEQYAEAAGWLVKAQALPVGRETRSMMDRALLAWALKAAESGPATGPSAEGDDPVRQAGREAALRLRRENLNASQRTELADAFETLGLEREAGRMAAAALNAAAGPRGMTSGMLRAGARSRSQLQTLVDSGKRAEAVKIALKQLRDHARMWVGNNDSSVRSLAQEWLQEIRRSSLLRELREAAGQETREDAASLALRGAEWDILGDTDAAVPLYRKSLELKPRDTGVRTALALALLTRDPKEAMPLIAGMDAAQFSGMTSVLQNMSEEFGTFESRFALLEAVSAILGRMTPEQAARQDMSWAVYLLENVMQQGGSSAETFRIGSLYEEEESEENESDGGDPPSGGQKAGAEAMRQRRLALHETVCRVMMRLPGLADPAFRRLAGVTLAGNLASPPPEELDTLALEALKVESRQRSGAPQGGRRYYYSNSKAIRLPSPLDWLLERAWRLKDPGRITDQVLPVIRQQGGGAVRDLEQRQALYFCPEGDFGQAVAAFLRRRPGSAGSGEASAGLETALRIMNLRGLQADLTGSLVESVEALNSSYVGGQELSPVLDYAAHLMDKRTPAEAREFLGRVAAAVLGPRERRKEFLEKNYQPSSGFSSPAALMIYRWIQMLRTGLNRPLLVLPMYVQAEEEFAPYVKDTPGAQPILQNYGSAFQRLSSVPEKPEEFLKFIRTTPLPEDTAGFRSYPDRGDGTRSPVAELLRQMSRSKKRAELAEALGALPRTFGTELMGAVLRGDANRAGEAVAGVLAAHLEEIRALPPERWADFTVLRKNMGGTVSDPGVKAFDEWVAGLELRDNAREGDRLLAAEDGEDLARGDNALASWLQPVLGPMILTGDPRLEPALLKVRALVADGRRERWPTQTGGNDGAGMGGRLLGILLSQLPALPEREPATRSVAAILNAVAAPAGFPMEWSSPLSLSFDKMMTAAATVRTAEGKKVTALREFAERAKLRSPAEALLFGPVRRLLEDNGVELSPEDRAWLDAGAPAGPGGAPAAAGVIPAAWSPPSESGAPAGNPPAGGSSAAAGSPPAGGGAPAIGAARDTDAEAEAWLRARMTDPALPLPVRMGLAVEAWRLFRSPAWPTVAAAAGLLTESWKAGQPVLETDAARIVSAFSEGAPKNDDAARTAGAELAAAWRKTLTEASRGPGSYGYRPVPAQPGVVSRAFLDLFLALGDTSGLNSLLSAVNPQVGRSWLALIVAGGQNETARRLVSPMRPGLLNRNDKSVKFTQALADRLPAFLEGIRDDRTRILTEALLVSLPDANRKTGSPAGAPVPPKATVDDEEDPEETQETEPAKTPEAPVPPAGAEEAKGPPGRKARLTALVERVPLDAFKTRAELEPLMAVLMEAAGSGEIVSDKMTVLLGRYVEGDSLAAAALVEDQIQRDLRCGLLRAEVIRKMKAGDIPAVAETLRGLEDARRGGQNYYAGEEIRKVYPPLQAAILESWDGWKPEIRQQVRALWLSLALDAGKDAAADIADGRRSMLALFLHALEDDMKTLTARVLERPAAVREDFTVRLAELPLQDALGSLGYGWSGTETEIKARKAGIFLRMLSQPVALPGWKPLRFTYFKSAEETGWITAGDILAHAGELLAKGPADASVPGELAVLQRDAGQTEAAAASLATTQERLKPEDRTALVRVTLMRSELLERQGRTAEALKLLTEFGAPEDLPVIVRKNLAVRLAGLKSRAALQAGGPEGLIAEFIAPLTEKPEDPERWAALAEALGQAADYLTGKGDAAAAANYSGMAEVLTDRLAARDPVKYRKPPGTAPQSPRTPDASGSQSPEPASASASTPAPAPGAPVRNARPPDAGALAAALGRAWSQLPAAFRDAVTAGAAAAPAAPPGPAAGGK